MSQPYDDTNPHFWPRDRLQPPPGRPRDDNYPPPEPQPRPDRIRPEKSKPRRDRPAEQDHIYLPPGARDDRLPDQPRPGRIRRKERPEHVHFPPAAAPIPHTTFTPPHDIDNGHHPDQTRLHQPRLEPFPPAEPSYPTHHRQPPYEPTPQVQPTVFPPPVDSSYPPHPHQPSSKYPTNLDQPKPTKPARGSSKKQHPHGQTRPQPTTPPFFPPRQSEDQYGHHPEDSRHGRRKTRYGSAGGLYYPSPERTNPLTWCSAVFCVIFWIAIILAGLLVLIIYLVYRPARPHFTIPEASLNAAYMDVGAHINIDISLLVNFTNMNRKMGVTIDFVTLRLYYENNLLANRYVEPFTAAKRESKVVVVDMVGSQVRLPVVTAQQLMRQLQSNRISFEVDSMFHARTSFGIYKYSYWMTRHCTFTTTGPPSGVMVVGESSCSAIH